YCPSPAAGSVPAGGQSSRSFLRHFLCTLAARTPTGTRRRLSHLKALLVRYFLTKRFAMRKPASPGGPPSYPKRKKKPQPFRAAAFALRAWRCPTLTWGDPTLPSALSVFTSEFGMGSGGSRSLLPPGNRLGSDGRVALFKRGLFTNRNPK